MSFGLSSQEGHYRTDYQTTEHRNEKQQVPRHPEDEAETRFCGPVGKPLDTGDRIPEAYSAIAADDPDNDSEKQVEAVIPRRETP